MNYSLIFGGVDVCEKFGCVLSGFKDEPPQPKTNYVSIPAGSDIDITDALGAIGYGNGKHVFEIACTGADAYEHARGIIALLHGLRNAYRLSWTGYEYTGRFAVTDQERISDHAEILTVEAVHSPWRTRRDVIDILATPRGSYTIEGSREYRNVTLTLYQPATVVFGGKTYSLGAGTHTLASSLTGDTRVTVTFADWWYYLDGTDLVVNPAHYTQEADDATFDSSFVISGTNLYCRYEQRQHAILSFTRRDI